MDHEALRNVPILAILKGIALAQKSRDQLARQSPCGETPPGQEAQEVSPEIFASHRTDPLALHSARHKPRARIERGKGSPSPQADTLERGSLPDGKPLAHSEETESHRHYRIIAIIISPSAQWKHRDNHHSTATIMSQARFYRKSDNYAAATMITMSRLFSRRTIVADARLS